MSQPPFITCPKCQRTSYNANDIAQGYCGHCHDWTSNAWHTTPHPCPTCNEQLDSATVMDAPASARPRPNDFSICTGCGEILVFNADMSARAAELNDLLELEPAQRELVGKAQRIIRNLRK